MNRPPLHLARPGQLPAPRTGHDSLQVLTVAIDSLARQRTAYWPGDSAVHEREHSCPHCDGRMRIAMHAW